MLTSKVGDCCNVNLHAHTLEKHTTFPEPYSVQNTLKERTIPDLNNSPSRRIIKARRACQMPLILSHKPLLSITDKSF